MFHVEQFAVSAYSGSTPAESRTQEAMWIFIEKSHPRGSPETATCTVEPL